MSDEFQDVNGTATDNASYEPEQGVQDSSDASLEQAETAEDSETSQSESERRRHGNGFQKRINKLIQQRENWKQKAIAAGVPDESESEASDFGQYQGHEPDTVQNGAERRDDYEQYYEARKVHEAHQSSLAEAREHHPDYDQVVGSVAAEFGERPLPPAFVEAVMTLPNSGEVMYQLSKDPNRMAEVFSMPLARAIAAIGRLSASLESSREVRTSKAPKPMEPVRGGRHVFHDAPNDSMSIEEWVKARERQLSRK